MPVCLYEEQCYNIVTSGYSHDLNPVRYELDTHQYDRLSPSAYKMLTERVA